MYKHALDTGSLITQHIIHCITLGSSGVGKTWLKNLLTGRPNSTGILSTDCLVPPDICLPKETFIEHDNSWKLLTAAEELEAIIGEFDRITYVQNQGPAITIENKDQTIHSVEPLNAISKAKEVGRTTNLQQQQEQFLTESVETESLSDSVSTVDSGEEIEESKSPHDKDINSAFPEVFPEIEVEDISNNSFLKKIDSLRHNIKSISPVILHDKAVIYFTDTGGQLSFHEIHPSLLTAPGSIYLCVMKLHDLDPQDEVNTLKRLDVIVRVLQNIYSAKKQKSEPEYKVVIVGTHKDQVNNVEDRLECGNRLIKKLTTGKPYVKYLLGPIIPIDSSQAGIPTRKMVDNDGVKVLLEKGKEALKINKKIPLCWWLFHLQIRHSFEESPGQDRKWAYKYDHLQELAKNAGISSDTSKDADQFYSMVKLFHSLGFWVYFEPENSSSGRETLRTKELKELKNWIVTSPNILYKYVSKLVNIQEREIAPSGTLQHEFKKTGFFFPFILDEISEDKLLNSIEVQQWFLDLLVYLHIGAKCPGVNCTEGPSKDPYYIIPAAFPEDKSITIPEYKSLASLYVTLADIGCIPTGMYCILIAFLVNLVSIKQEYKSLFECISGYSRTNVATCREKRAITIFSCQYGRVYLTETTDAICMDLVADASYFHIYKDSKILEELNSKCSKWRNVLEEFIIAFTNKEIQWQVKCHNHLVNLYLGSDDSMMVDCDRVHIASADQVAWFTNQGPSNAKVRIYIYVN